MQVSLHNNDRQRKRKQRRPNHTFYLKHRPFVVQPYLCAPVLPGETLENYRMQARVVSDPVVDKLAGCHLENYLFYVKIRDLAGRDDFEEMFVNPSKDMSSYYDTTDDVEFYYEVNGSTTSTNWAKLCYQRIIEEHFRGDDEAWNFAVDTARSGLAIAQVNNIPGWLDSMYASDDVTAQDVTISTAGDNAFTVKEMEAAYEQYMLAQIHGLTQKSFEDYLHDSGVGNAQAQEPHVPELLFYDRKWTYPTNTVEPTDGSVASAWVWSNTMVRNNKRFFKEPGFLMGLTVVRPKVYYSGLTSSPTQHMNSMAAWLPPDLRNQAHSARIEVSAGEGPAGANLTTEAYQYAIDDLLLYGDQWSNIAPSSIDSKVDLPGQSTDAINHRYPAVADIDALFVDSTDTNGLRYVRQDGIITLSVNSYVRDSDPGVPISN